MRRLVFAAVLLLLIVAAGFVGTFWNRIHEPYLGFDSTEQFVEIPAGTPSGDIGRRLVDAGVIRDRMSFRAALWWTGRSRSLQAGEYRFDHAVSPVEVVEQLAHGDVYARRITFPEGLTIQQMAEVYESQHFGSAKSFIEAAQQVALVRDLDPLAIDLEGYLFPDTYTVHRKTPAPELLETMVNRFRDTYSDLLRAGEQRAEQPLTPRQVVTLASLVEKETANAGERPLVAAVYRNRLRIGMPMQADPTVVYLLQKAGRYSGNITRQDLAIDSRYNTYRYPGLPPGPIAAPGRASLSAALTPGTVSYLYFVSRNDGSHVFADTLAQHNRNVREFQVLYFRR